jgi:hypothetical protein
MNPLRAWIKDTGTPRLTVTKRLGISQAYLSLLMSNEPPWPSRAVMRRIVELTDGAVGPQHFLAMDGPERIV